jgi:hypothetical protein
MFLLQVQLVGLARRALTVLLLALLLLALARSNSAA